MNKTFDWFKGFFEDNNSGASTTRALNWLWLLFLVGMLTFSTIKNGAPPVIDNSYVLITAALLSAKVGQRIFGEKPEA
jgi:hypothetical protein